AARGNRALDATATVASTLHSGTEGERERKEFGPVILHGKWSRPIVSGKVGDPLNPATYAAAECLVEAGDSGLTGSELARGMKEKGVRTSNPSQVIQRLRKDRLWEQVIEVPGKRGKGRTYRIKTE